MAINTRADLLPVADQLRERAQVSALCAILYWIASRSCGHPSVRERHVLCAMLVVAGFPALAGLPILSARPYLDRVGVLAFFWPSLLILFTSLFAHWAAGHMLRISAHCTELLVGNGQEWFKAGWMGYFTWRRQILAALIIAVVGTVVGIYILMLAPYSSVVRARTPGSMFLLLRCLTFLIAGFASGLAFFLGACSPVIIRTLRRFQFVLDPFAPAATPAIRAIGRLYGMIGLAGSIVGVFASTLLLLVLLRGAPQTFLTWSAVAIVPAWILSVCVFGSVRHDLYQIVESSRDAVRGDLQRRIRTLQQEGFRARDLGQLRELVELDRVVESASPFVFGSLGPVRTVFSFAVPVLPSLVGQLIKRLG